MAGDASAGKWLPRERRLRRPAKARADLSGHGVGMDGMRMYGNCGCVWGLRECMGAPFEHRGPPACMEPKNPWKSRTGRQGMPLRPSFRENRHAHTHYTQMARRCPELYRIGNTQYQVRYQLQIHPKANPQQAGQSEEDPILHQGGFGRCRETGSVVRDEQELAPSPAFYEEPIITIVKYFKPLHRFCSPESVVRKVVRPLAGLVDLLVHNPAQVQHDPLHGDPGSNCTTSMPGVCGASLLGVHMHVTCHDSVARRN